jgi:hypothetical protein
MKIRSYLRDQAARLLAIANMAQKAGNAAYADQITARAMKCLPEDDGPELGRDAETLAEIKDSSSRAS